MSHVHTSKAPEPLPTARRIFLAEGLGTVRESTETGIESTDMTYVECQDGSSIKVLTAISYVVVQGY